MKAVFSPQKLLSLTCSAGAAAVILEKALGDLQSCGVMAGKILILVQCYL